MESENGSIEIASKIDIGIVGVYLLLMVAIGFIASRFNKSDSDFFRGGNKMPWWLAAASLLMTSFSVYTFTGGSSMVYRAPGVAFTTYMLGGVGYFLGYLFLAARWRRTRSTTVFSYLSERYGFATNQVYSWTQMTAVFFQSGIMLLALSKFASVALGYEVNDMIIICGMVIAIYCLIGGLWAVVITDTLQFMVVFPCSIVTAIIAVYVLGGPGEFVTKLVDSWDYNVSGTYISGGSWSFQPSFLFAYMIMIIFASSSGAAAQRYFSVKTEKEARKVALFVAVANVISPFIWFVPPFVARYLDFGGDLLSISQALNMTAAEESTYVVFCLKYLPVGAMGIILAAMLSATMSTISSNFNVYAGVLTEDIIKQIFWKNATEKQLLLIGRVMTLLQGGIVIMLAILMSKHEGGVFQLMLNFSGIIIMPAGIPIFMGLIYKRTPHWAAIASYMTGLALGVFTLILLPEDYNFKVWGISLLSNPVKFEQQIFVFGTLSALVYFIPGFFLQIRGKYKERLDRFFEKLHSPIREDEVDDSELTDASSFRVTGWTTICMGMPVILMTLFPGLEIMGRLTNFSIGFLMMSLGGGVIYASKQAKAKREVALKTNPD